jgi:2',3'-cyclic-nucleotide 2'-phosphodiesterase (5'-nucleotidase family)
MGGLPRRATFIKQETAGDTKALILDAGNFVSSRPLAEQVMETAGAKAELMIQAMERMGYAAMAVGEMDLYLGLDRLRSLNEMASIRFLSANLTDPRGKALFETRAILKSGGVRVGVIGLTAPPADKRVLDNQMEGAVVTDPFQAAGEAVEKLRDKCDLLIVLSNVNFARNLELAETVPGIDMIISGGTKRFMKRPVIRNRTLITTGYYEGRATGKLLVHLEGKVAGWISRKELDFLDRQIEAARTKADTPQGKQRVSNLLKNMESAEKLTLYEPDMVSLTPSYSDDPEIAAMINEYRKDLKNRPGGSPVTTVTPREQVRYTGHEACADCHEARHRFWLTTGHYTAFDSLAPKNAEADPDCIPCHVTGYMRRTGYWPKAPKENLRGVQCESCHGVGSLHAADPENYSLVHLPLAPLCMDCHTQEQDGDFDYFRDKGKVCAEM